MLRHKKINRHFITPQKLLRQAQQSPHQESDKAACHGDISYGCVMSAFPSHWTDPT